MASNGSEVRDRVIIYPADASKSQEVIYFDTANDAYTFYEYVTSNPYVFGSSYAIEREKLTRDGSRWFVLDSTDHYKVLESLKQLREAAVM